MSRKTTVIIRYRSGQEQTLTCTALTVKFTASGGPSNPSRVTSLEWEDANPKPLFLNIGEIESIWEQR